MGTQFSEEEMRFLKRLQPPMAVKPQLFFIVAIFIIFILTAPTGFSFAEIVKSFFYIF